MQKDFRKDPRTVVSRQGDQIVVSLPDGTIEYARDAKHAYRIFNRWIGMPTGQGGGIRYSSIEWVGVDAPTLKRHR